ncbi:polymer-forming cytoskeletal protein [Paenibacillus sp.]|uniref:polymer-forming cytoskeletal protein n=1 Tax=Paenibacillus sp. TaxID=58172 RepID=UPI002811D114|nr:polymer-forming cytoskeletal protein [Paenibacillus sp.]
MTGDLKIVGMGTASGGSYRQVSVEGTGTVKGAVTCRSFTLNGMGTVNGDIRCEEGFVVSGKLTGTGGIDAARVGIEGQVTLQGRLRGESVSLNGYVSVRGDVEAEAFDAEGGFAIEGLLNAGVVDIRLQGRCRVADVGCDRIVVKRSSRSDWSRLLALIVPLFQPQLQARTIEGNDIDLCETTADIVRGDRVSIGPGCRIGEVEYRTELFVHPDATVGAKTQRP